MMKQRKIALVVLLLVAILSFAFTNPPPGDMPGFWIPDEYSQNWSPAAEGDNWETYVQTISDLRAPSPDVGTHVGGFAEMQDKDGVWDTLTEADTGTAANDVETFVNIQSNLHAETDIGTHSDWTELQDKDVTYDTLTEADTGGAGGTTEYIAGLFTDSGLDFASEANAYDGDWGTYATNTIFSNADDYPCAYADAFDSGAAGSGTITQVDIIIRMSITGLDSSDQWGISLDVGASTGTYLQAMNTADYALNNLTFTDVSEPNDASWSWADVRAAQVHLDGERVAGGDAAVVNIYEYSFKVTTSAEAVYDLDLEVGWNNADFDETTGEEICIFASTQGSEALRVDVWDSSWVNVIADVQEGWNNVTVASYLVDATFEMRFTDTSDEAVEADTYLIDCVLLHVWTDAVVNYDLDLEVGWTSADFDETTGEELCIFGGTQGAEALRVDVWTGVWTNVFTDIAVGWNNISVATWLTSAAFEIRFYDTTGDSAEADEWQVEGVMLHVWTDVPTNEIPVNDQVPTLDNGDDTTFMYAQYREYKITMYVSDADGFADIDYLELSLWDNTQTTEYFRFRYDEDTNVFTEEYDIGTVVVLNAGSSVGTETGNDIDAQFWFTVDWDFADLTDVDMECYVIDDEPESDSDFYEADFDVETRLEYSVAPSITSDDSGTVDRGDLDETFLLGGTLIYYGSTDDNPATDQVDVWVSASLASAAGPWSDLTLTAGAFSVAPVGDNVVGIDTYTVKPVIEAAGSGGTSLYYTTDLTDDYISDRVQVQSYTIVDDRVDLDANVNIDISLFYDYDNSDVTTGSFTINGNTLTYQSGSTWRFTDTESTVTQNTYDTVAGSDTTHGLTAVDQNSLSDTVTWDQIVVVSYTFISGDGRIDVDATVTIDVELHYDYDNTDVIDGTVTVNGLSTTYQSLGKWRFTDTEASVMMNTYDAVACTGNAEGITVEDNTVTEEVIWDKVRVVSYTIVTPAADSRVDTDVTVTIDVELHYDYDETDVIDGTVTVNGLSTTYQSAGKWRFTDSEATVMSNTYNTMVATGNAEGITVEDNTVTQEVIWDRVRVVSYAFVSEDGRVNTGVTVTIDVELHYDYDETDVVDGTVTVNGLSTTYQSAGKWRFTDSEATVMMNTYNTVVATGNAEGITVEDNTVTQDVIWDEVLVISYTISGGDARVNINDNVLIDIELDYNYDDTAVTDGTVTVNGESASHQGSGVWRITVSEATVQEVTYNSVVCSGNTEGITVVDQNSQSQAVIWDQIVVVSYTIVTPAGDDRVDTGVTVTIDAELHYDYDDTDVVDGTVTVNSLGTTYQSLGKWRFTDSEATVLMNTYDTVVCTGNAEGITEEDNTVTQDVIWDQIVVISYTFIAGDGRVDLDATVTLDVELHYDYDETDVVDGTVTVNGLSTVYQSLGKWRFSDSESSVMQNVYDGVVCTGNAHGITVEDNTVTEEVIWDQVRVVSYTIVTPSGDSRVDTSVTVTMDVELHYDYDETDVVDGTVTINGFSSVYQSAGKWRFSDSESTVMQNTYDTVAATGNAEGITVEDNTVTQAITWDEVQVQSYTIIGGDDRINLDATLTVDVLLWYDYDNSLMTDGTVTVNGQSGAHQGSGVWRFTDSESTVLENTYDTVVVTGNTEGITVVDQNSQSESCIWDRLVIVIVVDDTTPQNAVTTFFNYTTGTTIIWDFDDTTCTTYQVVVDRNSTAWYSFIDGNLTLFKDTNTDETYNYTVDSITSESTYGITVFTCNVVTVVWSAASNEAPVNISAPAIDNADDTDHLYAKYRFYIVTSNVSDADTYTDINYVELSIWDDARGTEYICIRYTVSGSSWSVELGSAYIILQDSSVDESGNIIDITWSFKVDWDFPDLANLDTEQYVYDGTDSDQDWYESDWEIETQLDYSVSPSLSDDRGNINTADLQGTGTVIYYGSALFPLANETDVWVVHDVSGTWSGDVSSGEFTISSIGSSASVRENTYTFKIVYQGEGSGGTDLYYTTSLTDTFITDSVTITIVGPTDGRQNLNANASGIVVSGVYDYGGAYDGTFTLNQTDFDGDGTAVKWGYTVDSISGDTYGVTVISSNDETSMIWDSVSFTMTDPTDQRDNLNANATGIVVTIIYDYDSTAFDGSYPMNNTDYDGDGTAVRWNYTIESVSGGTHGITTISSSDDTYMIWDSVSFTMTDPTDQRDNLNANATGIVVTIIYDYDSTAFDGSYPMNNTDYDGDGTAVRWNYTIESVSGGTHGITTISSGDDTYMIWDSITITMTDPTDQRDNLNANATGIVLTITYDYDSASFDGTFTMNNTDYNGDGTAARWNYTVDSVSGDTHGITTISSNDDTYMIWDSVSFTMTDPSDQRQNLDANATGITVTIIYDYDSTTFDGSYPMNNTDYDGDGTAVRWDYTIESVSGGTHGITTISSSDSTYMIWDSVTITIVGPTDGRQNLDANASGIVVSGIYDYDSASFDGTFTLNNTDFDGDGTAVKWCYNVTSVSGGTHGIDKISTFDDVSMIWDSLTIEITTPSDQRINTGSSITGMTVSAIYDYDSSAFDGNFVLNDTDTSHSVVGKYGYKVDSVNGDTYGITTISTNDEEYCIFDEIVVYITPPTDQRIDINANATGMVQWGNYSYDDTTFDGTVVMNNENYAYAVVTNQSYYIASISAGGTHGITVIGSYNETWCVFDQMVVSIVADGDNVENNVQVNFTLTVTWDFDSVECTVYLVGISIDTVHWYSFDNSNKSSFVKTGSEETDVFTAGEITESTHGITVYTSSSVEVVWTDEAVTGNVPYTTDDITNSTGSGSSGGVAITVAIPTMVLTIGLVVGLVMGIYGYQNGWFDRENLPLVGDGATFGPAQERASKKDKGAKKDTTKLGTVKRKVTTTKKGISQKLSNRSLKKSINKVGKVPVKLGKRANSKALGAQRRLQRKLTRSRRR